MIEEVKFLQKHIDTGKLDACEEHPISLALKDAGFKKPWIDYGAVWIQNKENRAGEIYRTCQTIADIVMAVEDKIDGFSLIPSTLVVDHTKEKVSIKSNLEPIISVEV